MKKKIQSYLVFVTRPCRFVLFLLVPLLAAGLQIWVKPNNPVLPAMLCAVLLLAAEIVMDEWVFGGIAKKGAGQLAYINSSKKGQGMIRSALTVSLIRQFAAGAVIFILCGIIFCVQHGVCKWSGVYMCNYLNMLLETYIFIVLTLSVTRFFDGMGISMLAAWIASGVLPIAFWIIDFYFAIPVLTVLAVMVSILHVRILMRRIKEGYCDKAD